MSFATYSDLADEIGSNPDTASVFSENFNSGAQPYDNLSQSKRRNFGRKIFHNFFRSNGLLFLFRIKFSLI